MMNKFLIFLAIILIIALTAYFNSRYFQSTPNQTKTSPKTAPSMIEPSISPATHTLAFSIAQFKERITKKPFGIFITPQNSPIQPERFTGYHTGADVEFEDINTDVPVYAIDDGVIIYSNWVSGYGGVLILKINLNNQSRSVLYGHLRPSSLPALGQNFKKGDQMAVLGTPYSEETDNERRHLHFAVLSDDRIDVKGYVQSKSALAGWIDPLTLYPY